MNAIGIDMSKLSFHASFDEKTVRRFPNTAHGVDAFMQTLCERGMLPGETVIGIEATGAYHLLFCVQVTKRGWCVSIVNPLESYRFANSESLRKVKTDERDAFHMRRMMLAGRGHPYMDTEEVLALKALVVEREGLVSMRAMMKQRREAHQAKQYAVARPLYDTSNSVMIALNKEIRAIERRFNRYAPDTQALLRSIPGVGIFSAAALVAFIGDIRKFSSPEKLTAYIGLDSRVFESGTSVKGKGYISKKGNQCLRRALWNAAFIARRHVPYLKAYFEKKRAEGKHYNVALCAVERKLVHLIYAVWQRGTPFGPEAPKRSVDQAPAALGIAPA